MISSDRLHTFAVFAEDNNLSRAAKRLHLSQPAVHAQLKGLADELGVPLYQRVGRGLVLTKEGIEVAAFAREIEERANELVARLRGEAGEQPLVLAAGAGALVHLLAGGLRAFSRARATARVEVVTADASHAVDLVRRGLAHVGVGVLDTGPAELDDRILARASQIVVVPRDHRLAGRRSVRLTDLDGEDLVAPPEGGPQRAALDAAFAANGVRARPVAVARGWDVVLRLVELGVGIGIVNDTCAIPRTLVARPLRELPSVTYRAFTRPRPRKAAVDLVAAFIAASSRPR
ncbi:MAG: LysR family transcriptional regulator [Labilithrix sp.]|nr:LysR family transcriptional regulator [Labilithrix sp.]